MSPNRNHTSVVTTRAKLLSLTALLALAMAFAGYACVPDDGAPSPGAGAGAGTMTPLVVATGNAPSAGPIRLAPGAAAGGFRARFSEEGASLTRAGDGSTFTLRVAASGRPSSLAKARTAAPREDDARTVYDRGLVREWFETTPNGIEHSFAIARRPAGDGPLIVDVDVAGSELLTPALVPGRPTDAVLVRRDGTTAFHYGALAARDADGQTLDASFEMASARLRVRVDDRGARFPVTVDPLIWAEESRLVDLHPEGADVLGSGLAIQGDRIVAGMNGRNTHRGGAAFFERKGAKWTETTSYVVPTSAPDHREQGIGAAVDGNTALLATGLPAQIMSRDADGGAWSTAGTLEVPQWTRIGGNNGARVALSGDTAVLSVSLWLPNYGDAAVNPPGTYPGALFFYGRDAGTWTGTGQIRYPQSPASWTYGNIVLQNDTLALNEGWSIFVYRRTADVWALETQLLPPAPSTGFLNGFGLDKDTIVAGCTDLKTPYVAFFERTGTTWGAAQLLSEPSPQFTWNYGDAAAIAGDSACVGDWVRSATGSVFRYTRSAGVWALAEEIVPGAGTGGRFGSQLAMTTDTIAIAAPGEGFSRGAVYVYANRSKQGDPCTSSDACATDFCVDGVCCDTACGGGSGKDCLACNVPGHVGTCAPAATTSVCRARNNDCDVPETCDGTNVTCPADSVLANGTPCKGGHCVAGACASDPAQPEVDASAPSAEPPPAASSDGGCAASPRPAPREGLGLAAALGLLALGGVRRARGQRSRPGASRAHAVAAFAALAVTLLASDADAKLVWRERQSFAPPKVAPQDGFGNGKVILQGNTAYLGTYGGVMSFGGVYVYQRQSNDWTLGDTIMPPDAQAGEGFGKSFAISGDTLAVGAFRDGIHGSVYVFVKDATGWTQQTKIPSPGGASSDFFGWSVALDGDLLVVSSVLANGSSGAVYVYTRADAVWTLATTLTGDPDTLHYGSSVALSGTTLAIGAGTFFENVNTTTPGHAYIYTGAADAWTLEAKLSRPNTEPYFKTIFFGTHVAIDGDTAVVTNGFDYSDGGHGGSAYVFARAAGVWTEVQTLQPSDSAYFDAFSSAGDDAGPVLHGDKLLLSASGNNAGQGAAYLFERSGGVWAQTQRFVASDASSNADFGTSGDFSGDMILLGSPGAKLFSGKVYAIFHGSEGDACTTGAPCASGLCVDGVCCDTACGGGAADDCMACSVKAGAAVDGTCGPTTPHVCRGARGDCDVAESCDGVNVTCPADLVAPNGRTCATGTCSGGKCLAVIPIPTAPQAMTPAPPAEAAPVDTSGGCSCRVTREDASWPWSLALLGLASLLAIARRRGRPRERLRA